METVEGAGLGIEDWRRKIDQYDERIIVTLAKRAVAVLAIGRLKKAQGVPPLDDVRWQEVLQSRVQLAGSLGLSSDFVESLYNLIHEYSLSLEQERMEQE